MERGSALAVGVDFYFAHCPERINPGDRNWTLAKIPRVVGANDQESLNRAEQFYLKILDAPVKLMASLKEAEAVKIIENTFRDINIAFVNELAMSFDKLGIDLVNVINGASTKPFAFLAHYPGCGVGGHCIPVDPYYLITYARKNGYQHRFLKLARIINNWMPVYAVRLLSEILPVDGARIALLGLAYKADIDDVRESPALDIRRLLIRRGAQVTSYDPYVPSMSDVVKTELALEKADAVIIATDHNIFKQLTVNDFAHAGVKVIIDGRNCLEPQQFDDSNIIYRGIGRGRPVTKNKHEKIHPLQQKK